MIWPGCPLFSSLISPRTTKILLEVFLPIEQIEWILSMDQTWPIDVPIIIDAFLLFDIQICTSSSGYVNVLQWNREWFFSRRVKFDCSTWWRYMKFPDMDLKSLLASPASGNELWGSGRDPSDSPRKSRWLSPRIGRCRIKVDVLRSWSPPPRGLIRPSAIGKINSLFSLGNITSFALSLFE